MARPKKEENKKMVKKTITLYQHQITNLTEKGDGNLSQGVRELHDKEFK